MPAEPTALHLLLTCARPISAPSANRSGRPSPTSAQAVLEELDGRIEAVLDGPPARVGIESTVLDLTGPRPLILRPGGLDRRRLEAALGVEVDSAFGSRRSPGTRYRHYAPDVAVRLFAGSDEWLRKTLARALLAEPEAVYIGLAATAPPGAQGLLAQDIAELQRSLYDALRDAEAHNRPVIAAWPPASAEAAGVRDRIWRAAGGHVSEEADGSGELP
jgi:L-threonylcarbamoyladenylate synthase